MDTLIIKKKIYSKITSLFKAFIIYKQNMQLAIYNKFVILIINIKFILFIIIIIYKKI